MPSTSPPPPVPDSPAPSTTTTRSRATARPRAGIQRKTKAEREEYARKEAERAALRDPSDPNGATASSALGKAGAGGRGRGRGGSGIGRGGAGAAAAGGGGRGGVGGGVAGASSLRSSDRIGSEGSSIGVFGIGSGQRLERGRRDVDLGISEALDGGEPSAGTVVVDDVDVKGTGGGGSASAATIGRGKPTKGQGLEIGHDDIQPDEDAEDQPRRDIERIWISSDDDEDAIVRRKGKQRRVTRSPKAFGGLRPVRAARATAGNNDDDGGDGDVQGAQARKLPAHVGETGDDDGNGDSDGAQMDTLPNATKKDPPSSPETSKRTLKKIDSRTKEKDPRILIETVEEKAERLRLCEDVENMKSAFLSKSDTDDTIDSKEEDAVFGKTDYDRMFLFQLPPLVPQLRQPSAEGGNTNGNEHGMDVDQVQVKFEDSATAAAAALSSTVTADQPNTTTTNTTQSVKPVYTADADFDQRFPQGFVGKLRIHKSGKVSLDWGGTDMEVRYGTEVDFLQDVICVQDDSVVKAEGEEFDAAAAAMGQGKAYAMGQISQKMVVIPDWARLYA